MDEMNPGQAVAVILNAGSGSVENADLEGRVADSFRAHGLVPDVHLCTAGEEISRFASQAVHKGYSVVVAGGGDGTVSAVAGALAGTEATLGVLPLGTLNHFAKDAGISLDLRGAVATIAEGQVELLDLGEVNGRTFINNSSLGLYPMIVRRRQAHQRLGRSKWWAFFRGLLTVLGRYPMLHVRVSSEQGQMVRKTPFLFVGNNEYEIHGLTIGTRGRIDGGRLSVYLTRRVGRWGLLGLVLRGIVGRLHDAEDFEVISFREFQVDVRGRAVRVALDGEVVLMESPLQYCSRPGVLRVLLPRRTE